MPQKPDPKPEPKREMDDATRIGRLVRTIQRIEKERDAELEDAPQSIHARARKRLHKAADGYPPHLVNAAWAAVEAMRTEAGPPESE